MQAPKVSPQIGPRTETGAPPRIGPPPAQQAPANTNVVHESEAQRQHARVRIPGAVEVDVQGQRHQYKLHDLSAGGFAFVSPKQGFRAGATMVGNLIVTVDQIAITLPVKFQVRNFDATSGRVGCCFQDLGVREISALRHLITSFLSGELVNLGDVLHTLGRDNFTKARKKGAAAAQAGNPGGRKRATVMSLLILLVGLWAFGFAVQQMHDALFVTSATVAKVSGPAYTIAMPREGTFHTLVPEDGLVKKGSPIGSFESPVFDLVRGQAVSANLSMDQLNKMLGQTVKGTITSPCDCRVQAQFVADAQYVNRGQPLFELVPIEFKNPHLIARFRFDQIDRLSEGALVQFRVSGDGELRAGRVHNLRVEGEGEALATDVLAMVEPLEALPPDLVNRPAEVRVGGLGSLPALFSAISTTRADEAP